MVESIESNTLSIYSISSQADFKRDNKYKWYNSVWDCEPTSSQ